MKELIVFLLMSSSMVYGFINQDYKKHFDDDYSQSSDISELRKGAAEIAPTPMTVSEISEYCSNKPDCEKLSEVIVWEARGEPVIGQYGVASVVLNRVKSNRFPNSIHEVVHQKFQFSYINDMYRQAKPSSGDWINARVVAYNLLYGGVEVVTDSTHYLNPSVLPKLPRWAKVYEYQATLGNHDFYKYR